MKYILALIFFSFLIVHCGQTELNNQLARTDKKVRDAVSDSLKYKQENYRLDTLFKNLFAANAFNGNVLVAKGSDIIYQKSFGLAIANTQTKLTDTSLFQLASVSKVITGLAILLLKEEGKLQLETKVSDILPEFPYTEITIKQLLSHRSGLPNYIYFCGEFVEDKDKILSANDALNVLSTHKPAPYLKPNVRFNYCNTNYVMLALIIEKISGKSYSDFLKDEIFVPLGMRHSFTQLNLNSGDKNLTYGYTMNFTQVAKDRYDGVLGDKGIYTTTYDLFLLSNSLYQNKLLKAETQALAYTPNSPEKKLSNYGLGWRMKSVNSVDKEVFHNGWWHGYRTSFHRRLKDSLTIIVLSNRLNKSVYNTWRIYDAIDGYNFGSDKPKNDEE